MIHTISCPICNANATHDVYFEAYGMTEEHTKCERCGYCYDFAYGFHSEYVGGKVFAWSYTTNKYNPVLKRLKRANFMARRNWKKRNKTYIMKRVTP